MNEPTDRPPLDLRRPRDVGALISDGWTIYSSNLRVLLGLGAAVIIPVELIVLGLGLGWFTADYDALELKGGEQAIVLLAEFLVIVPLVMAMAVNVLQDLSAGEKPTFKGTAQRAFDVFTPVMTVVVLVGGLALCGAFLLIIPGIFIAIALVFAPIVVVAEKDRGGTEALRRSWELVQGFWWRTFAVVVIIFLAGQLMSSVTLLGFVRGAEAADSAAIALAGQVLSSAIFTPFLSVVFGLFYFDQKLRAANRQQ